MNALLASVIALHLLAVPPLTPEQRAQLETAQDYTTQIDSPALYPLLANAVEWKEGDEAGAVVPDYQAIMEHPAAARGQLYLIEGIYYPAKTVKGLARPGPWSEHLQFWRLGPDPKDKDKIVCVYMVAPPAYDDLPRNFQNVRLVGRFYKVWHDADTTGKVRPYLVFVGHSAKRISGNAGVGKAAMEAPNPITVVVFVLIVSSILVTVWRVVSNRRWATARQKRLEATAEREIEEPADEEEEGEPLPEDPIRAMEEMERRRREKGEE